MSRNRKYEEYFLVVDLICIEKLNCPTMLRGWVRGFNRNEIIGVTEQWHNLKIEGIREVEESVTIMSLVRCKKLRDLGGVPDFTGAEDMRSFLELYDQKRRVEFDSAVASLEEQMRGFTIESEG